MACISALVSVRVVERIGVESGDLGVLSAESVGLDCSIWMVMAVVIVVDDLWIELVRHLLMYEAFAICGYGTVDSKLAFNRTYLQTGIKDILGWRSIWNRSCVLNVVVKWSCLLVLLILLLLHGCTLLILKVHLWQQDVWWADRWGLCHARVRSDCLHSLVSCSRRLLDNQMFALFQMTGCVIVSLCLVLGRAIVAHITVSHASSLLTCRCVIDVLLLLLLC